MKIITKLDVQKRVLRDGKPLDLNLFEWDENTKTFSSNESGLVLDFNGLDNGTFKTGSDCIFNTSWGCTFNTSHSCTFKTGSRCIFDTGDNCIFNTSWGCVFGTGSKCIFNTSYNCTFNTSYNCTFKTGINCVVVRKGIFEVIVLKENIETILCPYNTEGYLEKINDKLTYSEDSNKENEYIVVDNILSKIISRKGNVLKVQNYNETKDSYIIQDGDIYSHGETIEKARESLIYKISSRDTSIYKGLTLDSILTKEECIKMYRVITEACESGTNYFVSKQEPSKIKDKYSIRELIELTKGQYGNLELVKFMETN